MGQFVGQFVGTISGTILGTIIGTTSETILGKQQQLLLDDEEEDFMDEGNLWDNFLGHFFKWRNLSQTGKIGSGKNEKYFSFLLGLKYTLRTCFESKNFSSNSCPELSNQQLSFSACQVY